MGVLYSIELSRPGAGGLLYQTTVDSSTAADLTSVVRKIAVDYTVTVREGGTTNVVSRMDVKAGADWVVGGVAYARSTPSLGSTLTPATSPVRAFKFGDIVRVKDAYKDDRRWMVVTADLEHRAASGREWELMFLGPDSGLGVNIISRWPNLDDFELDE